MIGLFDYDLFKKREKYFLPNIYLMKCYNYYSYFQKVKMLYTTSGWEKYQTVFVFSENNYLNKQDLPDNKNIKFIGNGFYKSDNAIVDFINSEASWQPYKEWLKTALEYDLLTPFQVRKYTDASHIIFSFKKNNIIFETNWKKNIYENKRFVVIFDKDFFVLKERLNYFSQFAKFKGDIYFYHKQSVKHIKNSDIDILKEYKPKITISISTEDNIEKHLETIKKLNNISSVVIELVEHEISRYDSEKMWEERIEKLVKYAWILADNNIKYEYNLPFDFDVSPFGQVEKMIRAWNYERKRDKTYSILEGIAKYHYPQSKNPIKRMCNIGYYKEKRPKHYSILLGLLINYPNIFFPYFVRKPIYNKKEGTKLTGYERKKKIEELDKKLKEAILAASDKGVLQEDIAVYSKELQEYVNGCNHQFEDGESAFDSEGVCAICRRSRDEL